MKTSALFLAAAASIAAAQSIDDLVAQIPECVLPCIQEGAKAANCAEGDKKCECDNIDTISATVAVCIIGLPDDKKCADETALEDATKLTVQICALVAAGADGGDSTATPTTTGDSSEETSTDSATATGSDTEPTSSDDASSDSDSDDAGSDSTNTEPTSTPTETPGAANKASFAWAGAAAAIAAMAL